MDPQYFLDNWEQYWQNYAKLNPDLASAGIKTKRELKNHYQNCGIKENRNVISDEQSKPTVNNKVFNEEKYILNEVIFKEKLEC